MEPDLFYRACDEMGLMVIQDMPSLPSSSQPNPDEQAEFQRQLEILIDQHKSFTSICTWVRLDLSVNTTSCTTHPTDIGCRSSTTRDGAS